MKSDKKIPEYLTLTEVSKLLKVHPNTLRNWDKSGVLKSVRIGVKKLYRYNRADIMKLIDKNEDEINSKNE